MAGPHSTRCRGFAWRGAHSGSPRAKEGLAITNGTSLMSALLSLATVDAAMLCYTADVVGAMTLEALQATPAAFDPRIHAARPYSG